MPISRWLSVEQAAAVLSLTPGALRKILERAATRGADGVVEAHVDGVRGRKLGRLWRVHLSDGWLMPSPAASEPVASTSSRRVAGARRSR